jgi:hypothetical protein
VLELKPYYGSILEPPPVHRRGHEQIASTQIVMEKLSAPLLQSSNGSAPEASGRGCESIHSVEMNTEQVETGALEQSAEAKALTAATVYCAFSMRTAT